MVDYKKYFTAFVLRNYPESFEAILAETELHYQGISTDTAFSKTSKNPIDRRLDFCGYFLALIKTLYARGESYENIRKICLQITTEYVQPRNKIHHYFKRLIPRLTHTWFGKWLIKAFQKRVGKNANPAGFVARIITDKQETFGLGYGVDILSCGICHLFNKHAMTKYASILCEVDEITSGLAGLQLIRRGTIANGAEKCDFRYKLKD